MDEGEADTVKSTCASVEEEHAALMERSRMSAGTYHLMSGEGMKYLLYEYAIFLVARNTDIDTQTYTGLWPI